MKKNLIWSAIEFIFIASIQFLVMKFIVAELGVESLGVWSVLMSTAQVAGFFGMGIASGLGRHLAISVAENNKYDINCTLSAIPFAVIPIYLTMAVIIYCPLKNILPFMLHGESLAKGIDLIGYSLLVYAMQMISLSFTFCLNGAGYGFVKSQLSIFCIIVQAVLSYYLIKTEGLVGLAMAQIYNYFIYSALSVVALCKILNIKIDSFFTWNRAHIVQLSLFGLKLQSTSIIWACFEMLIRFVMSRFGGIASVGYYEVAYKMASQARILVHYAGQNIMPKFVSVWKNDNSNFNLFFCNVNSKIFLYSIIVSASIVLFSPFMSYLIFDKLVFEFIYFSLFASLGNAFHIMAISSELAAVAIGRIKFNFYGTLTALLSLLILGSLSGMFVGSIGVAIAICVSSFLAASVPVYFGAKKFNLSVIPKKVKFYEFFK